MKTGFVTLLMIGVAFGQTDTKCPKGKKYSCVGAGGVCIFGCYNDADIEWSAAANCADVGMGTMTLGYGPKWNYQAHKCEDHWYHCEKIGQCVDISKDEYLQRQKASPGYVSLGYSGGDDAGTHSIGITAPKPAKPPAKKAEPIIELMGATKCKIVPAGDGCNACTVCDGPNSASMCTTMYCTQKGEIEKLLKSPPEPPPNAPPLDVPAIRKTRVIHPKGTCWGEGQNAVCAPQKDDTEDYWDCEDPDAYSLQISVSGKAANCHRIVP